VRVDRDGDGCINTWEPDEGERAAGSLDCSEGSVPWSQLPPNEDCDDNDAAVCFSPELCDDGIDNDCDGGVDERDSQGCAPSDDDSADDDSAADAR
jgi:hypothetical protein